MVAEAILSISAGEHSLRMRSVMPQLRLKMSDYA